MKITTNEKHKKCDFSPVKKRDRSGRCPEMIDFRKKKGNAFSL
jgi:hypothetical protein